jgi:hypothetical protein
VQDCRSGDGSAGATVMSLSQRERLMRIRSSTGRQIMSFALETDLLTCLYASRENYGE